MTLGEYRVGITFNPSANALVDNVQRRCADLIDYLEEMRKNSPAAPGSHFEAEIGRLITLAQDGIEIAAMNGVKAATKTVMT